MTRENLRRKLDVLSTLKIMNLFELGIVKEALEERMTELHKPRGK